MDFCYGCGKVGHLLKDCNDKTHDEEDDNSNLIFGPWIRASPNRGKQSTGGETNNPRKCQKMLFKPPCSSGGNSLAHRIENNQGGDDGRNMEKDGQSQGFLEIDPDCLKTWISGTNDIEHVQNTRQPKELDRVLNTISDWHISPTDSVKMRICRGSGIDLNQEKKET